MNKLENTLTSMETAQLIEKEHRFLLRDIRRYVTQFNQCNLAPVEFFQESAYRDSKGETRPCYQVTKKGCEFIAHKLTGTKGTIFTARYINCFHEMQDILEEQEPELPWFIRKFRGNYIMLFRDFKTITGVEMSGDYTAYKRPNKLIGGLDYNGWGWKCDSVKFRQKYGFDYGDNSCMAYLYPCGIKKALGIFMTEGKTREKQEAYETIINGLNMLSILKKETIEKSKPKLITIVKDSINDLPIHINIVVKSENAFM